MHGVPERPGLASGLDVRRGVCGPARVLVRRGLLQPERWRDGGGVLDVRGKHVLVRRSGGVHGVPVGADEPKRLDVFGRLRRAGRWSGDDVCRVLCVRIFKPKR